MEIHKELLMGNWYNNYLGGFLAMFMPGVPPTNAAELKAAINIYDYQDIYAKSLGVAQYILGAGNSGGPNFSLGQGANRVALKKGPFDFAVPEIGLPAGTRKASLPDRIFICASTSPFDRLPATLGMASMYGMNMAPWYACHGSVSPSNMNQVSHGRSALPHFGYATCQEFEWDTPRTLTGVIRSSAAPLTGSPSFVLTVESWTGTEWETVINSASKTYSATGASYVAFSKQVTTSKLRLRLSYASGPFTHPHGIVPVEVIDTAPAQSSVPDITWAVLVPLLGKLFHTTDAELAEFSRSDLPVPMFVCKCGGPGDSVGFDMILSKNTQLNSSDMPALSGIRFNSASIVE